MSTLGILGVAILCGYPCGVSKLSEKNGIKLIGPTGDVIHQMGDKITSKALMKKAGVPVIEGTPEGVSDIEEAKEIARQIGYPVIVKFNAKYG